MPTYTYECTKGHQFEAVQRMTDAPLRRCRLCRSKVERLIVAAPFILKGGGWYSDGYSGKGPGKSSSEGSKGSESSTGSASPAPSGSGGSSSSGSESSSKPSSPKGSSTPAAAAS